MSVFLLRKWCDSSSLFTGTATRTQVDLLADRVGQWLNVSALALDHARIGHISALLQDEAARVASIRQGVVMGVAPVELEADLVYLLTRLRSVSASVSGKVDACLQSSRPELIDRASTPDFFKNLELEYLDLQNRLFGNYKRFFTELQRVASRPHMRLYDLASGRGGFYVFLAERNLVPEQWDLCASDVLAQPMAQGRARAEQLGLNVRFEQRDATDLGPLAGAVDLFTLQNAAHHLSPGVLIRVMYSAATTATDGIAIFDPVRSLGAALMVLAGCLLPVVTVINLYDALQSVRRCYSMAELVLLAEVAGLTAQARFVPPMFNHVWVRRRDQLIA